jgi:hypothetical protein
MATQKQIQANRRNAQKSTGPRSAEGKAASSQNALKSGIDANSLLIRGEDPEALAALIAEYFRDYQPQTAAERALVDTLIDSEWLLRRMRRVETHLWEGDCADIEARHNRWHAGEYDIQTRILGKAFYDSREAFHRLERRRDCLHRTHHRALHDLRELQAERAAAAELAPDPSDPLPTPSSESVNPEIGFVPQNPPAAATPAPEPSAPQRSQPSETECPSGYQVLPTDPHPAEDAA